MTTDQPLPGNPPTPAEEAQAYAMRAMVHAATAAAHAHTFYGPARLGPLRGASCAEAIDEIDAAIRSLHYLRTHLIDDRQDQEADHPFVRPGLLATGALARCQQCGHEEARHPAAEGPAMGPVSGVPFHTGPTPGTGA